MVKKKMGQESDIDDFGAGSTLQVVFLCRYA